MNSAADLTKLLEETRKRVEGMSVEERAKYSKETRQEFQKNGDLPPHKTFAIINTNTIQLPKVVSRYWAPALSEAELKTLLYLIDKTFGYDKEEGDAISLSQMTDGVVKKDKENGKEIRIDWGVGVKRKALLDALMMLELLGLVQVIRGKKENSNENKTNMYKVKIYEEYENMSADEKKLYMSDNPYKKVELYRGVLEEMRGSVKKTPGSI
jgi:flagellar biosynthesis/type III secretory pathway M-ring protein FliF/YscJ